VLCAWPQYVVVVTVPALEAKTSTVPLWAFVAFARVVVDAKLPQEVSVVVPAEGS